MRFFLSHPDFTQYGFYLMDYPAEIERDINRLGPVKLVSGTYDWPKWYSGFRSWTDTVNSLWWPPEADKFATCVALIDDSRNDLINRVVSSQRARISVPSPGLHKPADWRFPWLILSARLSPPAVGRPGEAFPPAGVLPVDKETPLIEWKLYPLAPINISSLDASNRFRGLWLLPLVDIRYFYRNVPLNDIGEGSSSSGCHGEGYPLIRVDRTKSPNWMPPLLAYPQDKFPPSHYVSIVDNGTSPTINGASLFGEAADAQAKIENWRIVCRDVRSNYNVPVGVNKEPHNEFTGVIADYPERFDVDEELIEGYHIDVCKFIDSFQARRAGGLSDVRSLDEFIARTLQFVFEIVDDDYFYSVTIGSLVDFPTSVTHFAEDVDGPDEEEKKIIPAVMIGKRAPSRSPNTAEKNDLITAATQWSLLYHLWRRKQAYFKFPGIFPIIPNGHAHAIRWDFSSAGEFATTYIALEGVQGTNQNYCVKREPFYARIDGEGALEDNLHGHYAWTKLLDKDGELVDYPNPRKGYVAGVNGQFVSVNPARDEAGKVAVPVGLVVWLKPGVPFLDVHTCTISDHFRFTTGDLLQIIKLKPNMERNKYGHLGAIIRRWNPDIKGLVDSEDTWAILLE